MNVTVVAAVAGFLLYELGWLSNAVTLSVAAAYWCLFLLPTAYAVVTVLHPGFGLIDYSVYCSLDHALISRVVGRALAKGRPPGLDLQTRWWGDVVRVPKTVRYTKGQPALLL